MIPCRGSSGNECWGAKVRFFLCNFRKQSTSHHTPWLCQVKFCVEPEFYTSGSTNYNILSSSSFLTTISQLFREKRQDATCSFWNAQIRKQVSVKALMATSLPGRNGQTCTGHTTSVKVLFMHIFSTVMVQMWGRSEHLYNTQKWSRWNAATFYGFVLFFFYHPNTTHCTVQGQ